MTEIRSRVLLAGLTAVLAGFALVNMVVDRRSLAKGGRELSWWSGLALDVSTWFRSVLIDRGQNHGVHAGMPLISDLGLVGLVTATSRNAAKGMLLLDRQSAVSAVVQRSRDRGVVRGTGDGLVFEFVGRDADVAPGDVLITSGLGGVFPKGLRIGVVSSVEEPSAQLLREANVDPVVDFGRLEQVFVMLRRGPTMDLLYATEGGDQPDPAPAPGEKNGS